MLAQAAGQGGIGEALLWLGGMIVLLMIAAGGVLVLRARLLDRGARSGGPGLFLDELRAMRDRGELSPAEYDAARSAMAARLAGGPRSDAGSPDSPATLRARPGVDLTGDPLPDSDSKTPLGPDAPAD